MKKLFTFLFCAALLGGVAGCSDDDDKAGFDQALLIGTWLQTERYWSDADGEKHATVQPKEAIRYTFLPDGTGTETFGNYTPERFTYRIDRYLWIDFPDTDSSDYEVETLTDAVLVLVQSGSDEDGDWLKRETYVRVAE